MMMTGLANSSRNTYTLKSKGYFTADIFEMAPTAERIPDEDWNKKFQILIHTKNL